MDYCSVVGGDEGPAGTGKLRISRDDIRIPEMCQAGKRGGTDSLDEAGEEHLVERGGNMAGLVEQVFDSEGKGAGGYQICSVLWANNCWIMSECKTGLPKRDGRIGRTHRQQGDGTEAGISLVDRYAPKKWTDRWLSKVQGPDGLFPSYRHSTCWDEETKWVG